MHLSVFVYVSSTPAVVVKDMDDYGSLFSVNLAGGSVAGSVGGTGGWFPPGSAYVYGTSIAAGATLGSMTFSGSPYSLTYAYSATFWVIDSADTAAEGIGLAPGGQIGYQGISGDVGAAAGANESLFGYVGAFNFYSGGSGSYSNNLAVNKTATTANCTVELYTVAIFVEDFIPGPGTIGETW